MPYRFVTVDVFTDRIFGGNPLAVFPEAAGLASAEMQSIATECTLSETVFHFPPRDPGHTSAARIFTPAHELPFACHPTIGAAFVLAIDGRVDLAATPTEVILEEQTGLVRVRISADGGAARLDHLYGTPPS